ncbi:MAG TPA: DNA-binding response regulator, partial [Lachnoclostridium sp.]|nr:DNA-binding response regulator [Lachnoclostridium sp.]
MYQVLLVDDETIILSGIKFLIDWEKQNCNITGSARNGRDALEKIRNHPPDIVFCDIKMPVMDGMELLQIVNEEFPSVVFIMLTNFQEFSLAREALRLHAVDYLLKAQLEANALIKSLSNAKKEYDNRAKLFK